MSVRPVPPPNLVFKGSQAPPRPDPSSPSVGGWTLSEREHAALARVSVILAEMRCERSSHELGQCRVGSTNPEDWCLRCRIRQAVQEELVK